MRRPGIACSRRCRVGKLVVVVRGVVFGVFDQPLSGAASSVPASISGEVQFNFPFEIQ